MRKTVEAVRERERETNFNELGLDFCAQNTVYLGIKTVEKLKINREKIKKGWIMWQHKKLLCSLSFLCTLWELCFIELILDFHF